MTTYYSPPQALMQGMGTEGRDFVYLFIDAYECQTQFALARAASYSKMRGSKLDSWELLISSDVNESINHTWGKYEAMAGKLMELMDEGTKTIVGATTIVKSANLEKAFSNPASINQLFSNVIEGSGLAGQQVGQSKIDASTVYQDSQNRTYTFEFEFVAYQDPKFEVYEPVRRLMELSCADTTDSAVGIQFPAIFEIFTATSRGKGRGALSIKNCALTSVQPTWKFPWKEGYPMSASVALTFVELPPLYRKTLNGKELITVTSNAKNDDLRNNH